MVNGYGRSALMLQSGRIRLLLLLGASVALVAGAHAQGASPEQAAGLITARAEISSAMFELASNRPVAAAHRLEELRAGPAGRAAGSHPDTDRELRFLLATAYFRMGASARFRNMAEPLLGSVSADRATVVRAQLALDAYGRGDDPAVAALLAQRGSEPVLLLVAGLSNYRRGSYEEAREAFDALRRASPAYEPYARYLAALSVAASEPARTVEAVDSLRAIGGDAALGAAALYAASRLAYSVRRYDITSEVAAAVPAASGSHLPASTLRAWALYHLRQLDAAAAAFAAIAERYPETPEGDEARVMSAQALLEASRPSAAAERFSGAAHQSAGRAQAVSQVEATGPGAVARALVSARSTEMLFLDAGSGIPSVASPAGGMVGASGALRVVSPTASEPLLLIVSGDVRERWITGVQPRIGSGVPLRILREPPSGRSAGGDHRSASVALRDADVHLAIARYTAADAEMRNTVRLLQLERMGELAVREGDGLSVIERRLLATHDSLVQVLGSLGVSRDRVRRYLSQQIDATRELAGENVSTLDSVRASLSGHTNQIESEILGIERSTSVEFVSLARLIEQGLEGVIQRHPVFAYHDTVGARLERNRVLLAEARGQLAVGARIAREELERQRALVPPDLARARTALDAAIQRQAEAEERLVALVEMELSGRIARVLAQARRDMEVAEYGAASALFFAALQEDVAPGESGRGAALSSGQEGGAP
jgi:hypothetical protein